MRALLGSGGFRTEERRELYNGEMRRHFGDVSRILFVPYALHDHEKYTLMMSERGLDGGYEIDGIHRHDDPVKAVMEAEAISVGGGNTFRLTADMHRLGLFDAIRHRVMEDDIPYMGVSRRDKRGLSDDADHQRHADHDAIELRCPGSRAVPGERPLLRRLDLGQGERRVRRALR